jgi:hexosaminidase
MQQNTGTSLALTPNFSLSGPQTLLSAARKVLSELACPNGTIEQIALKLVTSEELEKLSSQKAPLDSYYVHITEKSVSICSESIAGLFYGVNLLLRRKIEGGLRSETVFQAPSHGFRGLKIYLPAREDIPYFCQTIDMAAYFGFNRIVIEVGGAMEYKRHPEINEGWEEYTALFSEYQGKSLDIQHSFPFHKNSIHCENGGGSFLLQDEVRSLVDYCTERGLEVIPEVPCLSHCDYLLTRHRELAERQDDPIPDTYCPSDPRSYELLFDVLEEVIDVFRPKLVHIGHDEFYTMKLCDRCKDRNGAEIYATDIIKIYTWLKERGIETMMWGEKLLEVYEANGNALGGLERDRKYSRFLIPETYKARDILPKDIKIMHWYWCVTDDCELQLFERGFEVTFGNFTAFYMHNWPVRVERGVKGICISNWSGLNAPHMQRNAILIDLAMCSMLLWDPAYIDRTMEENIPLAAKSLFLYQNRHVLQKPHLRIQHASNIRIPHKAFVDGYTINFETDHLGTYTISYADGTEERLPVYYGLNIGAANAVKYRDNGLLEATGTCFPEVTTDGTVYTLVHPLSGPEPVAVSFTEKEGKEGAVKFHKAETVN